MTSVPEPTDKPYYQDDTVTLHHGHALNVARTLASESVQTIVTSPPYFGLRDYGEDGQIGAESTISGYVESLVKLFHELHRVLADDGVLWLNIGDSYATSPAGNKPGSISTSTLTNPGRQERARTTIDKTKLGLPAKSLLGIPWRTALALQEDGWILRSDIIWSKPRGVESVRDRPSVSHEYIFMLTKQARYFYDAEAVRSETGANKRTVWDVTTVPFDGGHLAVYPPELIRPCVLAGSRSGDVVLDPFSGSGTTGMVATQEGRRYVGIDLNAEYLDLSLRTRFKQPSLDVFGGM